MTALITLNQATIDGAIQQAVNARELYAFLESKQEFSNWIKRRIEDYSFVEGKDFLTNLSKTPNGRPRLEYALSLDMAKELSMLERSEKGKQARQYFIQCEKRAKLSALPDFTNPIAAARAWADEREKNAQAAALIQEQTARLATAGPKAAALDLLSDRTGTQNITLTAKELKTKRNDLIALLREIGWIYRTYGNITASRYAEQQGYMIQNSGISDRNGAAYSQALITHKGKAKLAEIIAKQKIGGAGK